MPKGKIDFPANFAYKFRIEPTKKQQDIFNSHFIISTYCYNYFIGRTERFRMEATVDYINTVHGSGAVIGKLNPNDKFDTILINGSKVDLKQYPKADLDAHIKKYFSSNGLWFKNNGYTSNDIPLYTIFTTAAKNNPKYSGHIDKISSLSILSTMKNLSEAFSNIKKSGSGFPKFKKQNEVKSYSVNINNLKISFTYINNKNSKFKKAIGEISLPSSIKREFKIDNLKVIIHREEFFMNYNNPSYMLIKNATVSLESDGKYYISFGVHLKNKNNAVNTQNTGNALGIDMNNGHITTEDVNLNMMGCFNRGNLYTKEMDSIKMLDRQLSTKVGNKKGEKKSRNYKRILKKRNIIFKKISNKVTHLNNNVVKKLVDSEYDTVMIEDLSIKNMTKRTKNQTVRSKQNTKRVRSRRRNTIAMGINSLSVKLENKLSSVGKTLVKVNAKYTSKRCSNCGEFNMKLTLEDRVWTCPKCGVEHDRDLNAAINIKEKGMNIW